MITAIFMGVAACITASVPLVVAIGGLAVSAAVAVFIVLCSIAIIYAIHEGYDVENVEIGTTDGRPSIKFSLRRK